MLSHRRRLNYRRADLGEREEPACAMYGSEPTIASNFNRLTEHKNISPCRLQSPAFFSVSMTGDKFVFRQEKIAAVSGILNFAKNST